MKELKKSNKYILNSQAQIRTQMTGLCIRFTSGEIGDHAREVLEDLTDNKFDTFEELERRALEVLAEARLLI